MKITKNGFYIFEKEVDSEIIISEQIKAKIFFKNISGKISINLENTSDLEISTLNTQKSNLEIEFFQKFNNSNLKVKSLYYAENYEIFSFVKSTISGKNNFANIQVFGISKNGNLALNSNISILKNSFGISADLSQKNIFIGKKGKISGTPQLFVKSKDVKANHSLKIEKLDEEILFYVKSRGLSEEEAEKLLIGNIFREVLGDENFSEFSF